MTNGALAQRKWRVGPPTRGTPGTLYDFVRRMLCERGGSCLRHELLEAIEADLGMKARLAASRGFAALVNNMRHSGDILVDGQTIVASPRTLRRMSERRRPGSSVDADQEL